MSSNYRKTILLTGGSGMVGRNILNHEISSEYNIIHPSSKELDLSNFNESLDFIKKIQPEFIIHAAGKVGGIHANIAHPVDFLIDNLDYGRNIVMAAYHAGVKSLLNLGSSCMYPRNAQNPLEEHMILGGELEPTNEGYALAKIMTARLCEYIQRENSEFQYKTMIPCNIYGSFDKFDPERSHMIPAIINKLHNAISNSVSEVEIWGDGKARREFMYAQDLANAIYYAIDNFSSMPSMVNIGMGLDYTINEYYETIAKVTGYKGKFRHNLDKPVGMRKKLVSIERQSSWGWKPVVSLQDGVKKTYEYYIREVKR
jgi:GDP-L-fucose synthase